MHEALCLSRSLCLSSGCSLLNGSFCGSLCSSGLSSLCSLFLSFGSSLGGLLLSYLLSLLLVLSLLSLELCSSSVLPRVPTGALPGGAATPVVFWVLLGAAVLRASPWVCVVGVVSGPTTGGWCSRIHTQILPRGPV